MQLGCGRVGTMPSLIEKPDGTIVLTVRITFKPERDKYLIELISSAPSRGMARLIRETMRNGSPKFTELNDPNELESSEWVIPDLGIDL